MPRMRGSALGTSLDTRNKVRGFIEKTHTKKNKLVVMSLLSMHEGKRVSIYQCEK